MTRSRYRLIRRLIPAVIALYVVMLPLNSVLEEDHGEIFPFFSWRLFSRIPDWQTTEYGLLLHSIDGAPLDREYYLIPSDDVRDWKALRSVVKDCRIDDNCDGAVASILYPILFDVVGTTNLEFSIVKARVDLHDIQDHIDDLAVQAVSKTSFFRPGTTLGRWNTQVGRLQ